MRLSMVRWIQLPVALIGQLLFMAVYPILHFIWKRYIFTHYIDKSTPQHLIIPVTHEHSALRDNVFHDNDDEHGAYSHVGLHTLIPDYGEEALRRLVTKNGKFLRMWSYSKVNDWCPSSDTVVFWCFTFSMLPDEFKPIDALHKAATSYLLNLGAYGTIGDHKVGVSKRCANFGVMKNADGWSGPANGHQYYNSAALFALAAKYLGGFWHLVFWVHWIIYGGWYWQYSPVLYPGNIEALFKWIRNGGPLSGVPSPPIKGGSDIGYVRDVTMKALFVLKTCYGSKNWITKPMLFITDYISKSENALFYSMLNRDIKQSLPSVLTVSAWQNTDSRSFRDKRCNIWLKEFLLKVKEKAKTIK
jgi:hypothetical protein